MFQNAPAGPCAAVGALIAFVFPLAAIPLALFVPVALLWLSWTPKKKAKKLKHRIKKKRKPWTSGDLERLATLTNNEPTIEIDDFAQEYLGRIERHETSEILNLTDVDLRPNESTEQDVIDLFLSRKD